MIRRLFRGAIVASLALVAALLLVTERPASGTGHWLREAGISEQFALVAGMRLCYVRAGNGPTLLLLHGLASSIYTWSEVLPDLARDHDVIALDFPGFGQSDRPENLRFEELQDAALGLLDRLGVERAALAGNSLGGAVASVLAARHPERVERLVLIDSAGFNFAQADRPALLRLVGAVPVSLLERLPAKRALTRIGLRQVLFDPQKATEERVEEYLAPLQRPGTLRSMRSLLGSRATSAQAFGELAARIAAPSLILWGREDRWIPVAQAELFAKAIVGSRLVVLRGCGHVPQEERPTETAALMRSFLAAP